jgi:flagellar basal-body rod protein FlgB
MFVKIFSSTFTNLERGINYSNVKQKTIAQNIANVDTPNYKAKDVQFIPFSDHMKNSLQSKKTDPRHFDFKYNSGSGFKLSERTNTTYNNNGNNVDIDMEMSELAQNQIYYNALTERMGSKFSSLKNIIRGGK